MIKRLIFLLLPIFSFSQNQDYFKKANYFFTKSRSDSAVFYYKKAIDSCKSCENSFLADNYLKLGESYRIIGKHSFALSYLLNAQDIFEELNNKEGLIKTKIYLAEFYRSIDKRKKAFEFIEEARLSIEKQDIDKNILAFYYNRRAPIIAITTGNRKEIAKLSKKAIVLAKDIGDNKILVYSQNELATVYRENGERAKALALYSTALEVAEKNNMLIPACDVLFNIIRIEINQTFENLKTEPYKSPQSFNKTRELLKKGLIYAQQVNYLERMRAFSQELYFNYRDTKQYEEAFNYFQLYYSYANAVAERKKSQEIAEIEAKYLDAKKDNQLLQNQDRIQLQYIVLISLLVIVIVLVISYLKSKNNQKSIKNQKEKIEEILHQRTTLLKEVHHRVKNNLQLTSSLLYLQSNKHDNAQVSEMVKESQKHINSIALVHEMLYQEDEYSLISMQKYLKELTSRLLQFSTQKDVQFSVIVNKISLPIDYATTLGLIINELITNSLKYAFDNAKGEIIIQLQKLNDNNYKFIYADNGKGLKEIKDESKKTLGAKLIKMFAEEINAELEIKNKNGLAYTFIFKNKYK